MNYYFIITLFLLLFMTCIIIIIIMIMMVMIIMIRIIMIDYLIISKYDYLYISKFIHIYIIYSYWFQNIYAMFVNFVFFNCGRWNSHPGCVSVPSWPGVVFATGSKNQVFGWNFRSGLGWDGSLVRLFGVAFTLLQLEVSCHVSCPV